MTKRGGKQPHQIPYCGNIAAKVKKMAPTNTVKEIFSSIQSYQNAPASLTTFYKLYRSDMDTAKGNITQKIGNKVIDTALRNDEDDPAVHKAREFYLDRKGGWTKKETVETREVDSEEEETKSGVAALMASLGKEISEEPSD